MTSKMKDSYALQKGTDGLFAPLDYEQPLPLSRQCTVWKCY
jgi:hypothetical protein